MNLSKKLVACAMATVLVVGSAVGVWAAGSRTNDVTVSGASAEEYKLDKKIEETEVFKTLEKDEPKVAETIIMVNKGEIEMKDFAEILTDMASEITDETAKADLEEVITKLEDKDFVTGFVDLTALEDAKKNDDGKYEITIDVPSLTEEMKGVEILHYSTERKLWEIVEPDEVDAEKKTLTAQFEDLSPIAIISDTVEDDTESK